MARKTSASLGRSAFDDFADDLAGGGFFLGANKQAQHSRCSAFHANTDAVLGQAVLQDLSESRIVRRPDFQCGLFRFPCPRRCCGAGRRRG